MTVAWVAAWLAVVFCAANRAADGRQEHTPLPASERIQKPPALLRSTNVRRLRTPTPPRLINPALVTPRNSDNLKRFTGFTPTPPYRLPVAPVERRSTQSLVPPKITSKKTNRKCALSPNTSMRNKREKSRSKTPRGPRPKTSFDSHQKPKRNICSRAKSSNVLIPPLALRREYVPSRHIAPSTATRPVSPRMWPISHTNIAVLKCRAGVKARYQMPGAESAERARLGVSRAATQRQVSPSPRGGMFVRSERLTEYDEPTGDA